MPLICSVKDYTVLVTSQTISNHAKVIMCKLPLSAQMVIPSRHATGSTTVFQQDAPSSDIATNTNWSLTILFD
ncbi:hypothetical protein CPC16_006477, partial [Podila verticillata]